MELALRTIIGAFVLAALLCLHTSVLSCNEVVCGSIVSKCMLTQSCRCSLKNCSCCEECLKCLGKKYFQDCCSCVELCPPPANDTRNQLSKKSNIVDFEGVAGLFNVLAISPAEYDWDVHTFQIDFDAVLSRPKQDKNINYFGSNDKHLEEAEAAAHGDRERLGEHEASPTTMNCTVFYLEQCVSWNKCQQTCKTTGASSCRWFHDGCCECVGYTCINYGINESRCRNCPVGDDSDVDDPAGDEEAYDFGDSVGPFDGSVNNNF